jgi:hypothetical protein
MRTRIVIYALDGEAYRRLFSCFSSAIQRSDRIARIKSKTQEPRQRPVFIAMHARMASDTARAAADRYRGKYRVSLDPSRETTSTIDEQVSQKRKNERVHYRLFFNATEE